MASIGELIARKKKADSQSAEVRKKFQRTYDQIVDDLNAKIVDSALAARTFSSEVEACITSGKVEGLVTIYEKYMEVLS